MYGQANASMSIFVGKVLNDNSILLCYLFLLRLLCCGVLLLGQLSGRDESFFDFGKAAQVLVLYNRQ